MIDSFVFYRSFYESMTELPDDEKLALIDAICEYALNDIEIDLPSVTTRAIFRVIRETLKSNAYKRETGHRGGRPRKSTSETSGFETEKPMVYNSETSGFETENHRFPKSKSTVTVTDTVTDTVTVTETGTDIGGETAENPPPAPASSGKKKFIPPTLDEVAAYCNERHNGISPSAFIDYYEARGWKYGTGKPMVNWKAAVRTWEQKDKDRTRIQGGPPGETAAEANARIFDELFGGNKST